MYTSPELIYQKLINTYIEKKSPLWIMGVKQKALLYEMTEEEAEERRVTTLDLNRIEEQIQIQVGVGGAILGITYGGGHRVVLIKNII